MTNNYLHRIYIIYNKIVYQINFVLYNQIKNQVENTKEKNTNKKIQISKYKYQNTNIKIQISRYK